MSRMQGAQVQCCMCITGVFMFLGGVVMLATGITLLINYNIFEVHLLPPLQNTDQGKKTAGIILTCFGLIGILISVLVSLLFHCNRSKTSAIDARELSQLPPTEHDAASVKGRPSDKSEVSDRKRSNGAKLPHSKNVASRPKQSNVKSIPGSTEMRLPRTNKTTKHRNHYGQRVGRLAEIKEQEVISRKTVDGAITANECNDNESVSSEMMIDNQQKIPRIILGNLDDNIRRPSLDSATPSQASDISNDKAVNIDKARQELQFLPESTTNKDMSGQYDKDSVSVIGTL